MSLPILQTKLYPPLATDGSVLRSRLIERVQAGVKGRLTIVSAPPGFGKTTLLSAWIATSTETKLAWYSFETKHRSDHYRRSKRV